VARGLSAVGVDVSADQIATSAQAAAELLAPQTRCLVVGMEGLRTALAARGVREVHEPADADAVVVGLDQTLQWDDLRRATIAIRRGARFIATNTDATLPVAGAIWPGNGAIVAALKAATDVEPEVAGKPFSPLLRTAERLVAPGPVLMVGDRHETDIAGAAALGWDTALVLSGVTTQDEVAGLEPAPTYVLPSVAGLLQPAKEPSLPDVRVRTAAPGDIPAIIQLWGVAGMLGYTAEPERDLRLAMSHDPGLLVVAQGRDAVVGVAFGSYDGRRGWLMRVAVDPAARRTGVASAMVGLIEARLRHRGAPQVDVLVFDDNTEALHFWPHHGYRQTDPVSLLVKRLD
jgi:HAD superfamily hydrolase (TIGR01450 family)